MKKLMHNISVYVMMTMSLFAFVSCGLVDFDFDEALQDRYEMHLSKDTLYIMEGDSFSLYPIFTPELPGGNVYWSVDNSYLEINEHTIYATNVGNTYVKGYSPVQNLQDSCFVSVMPKWESPIYDYPDETIVYARVIYRDKFLNPFKMKVAAFIDGECRGVGELKDHFGIVFIQFRVYGDLNTDQFKTIRFRLYYLDELLCEYFPQKTGFSGTTIGSLSSFFMLSM